MDFVSKFTGGDKNEEQKASSSGERKEGGGFLGGIGDKINSAAGGGKESEKNEDYLDKGECYWSSNSGLSCQATTACFYYSEDGATNSVQVSTTFKRSSWAKDHRTTRYVYCSLFLHDTRKLTESQSAVEQAKDEQISDFIRKQYKGTTGKDVPIKDKETTFG